MSDGISDGLGRPMNERELRDALEEAQRFAQFRTQEVVTLTAEVRRLGALVEKIRAVTGEPSGGHDLADEVLGLLRVAQRQRDDADRASRSSSGSGEREALEVGGAIVAWVEQELRAEDTEGTAACPGYPDTRKVRPLLDRWRALSSASPSPDSGDRVRALEEALSDLVRFQPEEGRANRSHYAEHGMLCLAAYDGTGACDCGWTEWKAAEDLARRALSPQGDGGTER